MAELLFLLAYVNRENDLESINEGAFPSEDRPTMRFGLSSELYFFSKEQPEKKDATITLAEAYYNRTVPHPNILVQESTSCTLTTVDDIRGVLESSRNDDPTVGDLKNQVEDPDAVLSFYTQYEPPSLRGGSWARYEEFDCLVVGRKYRPDTSKIMYHDRIAMLLENTRGLIDAFAATCEEFQVFYAVSGLSIFLPNYSTYNAINAFPVFQRFPGMIYADLLFSSEITAQTPAIRDVNWLTAINADMFAQVGGDRAAGAALGPDIVLHHYNGGVIFQAGPLPRLGDVNAGDIPEPYRQVARFLKPIQYNGWTPPYYLRVPDGVDRAAATTAWINRFD